MTTYIKSGGVYKPIKPSHKAGGAYNPIKKLYCKVDGEYRLIHDDTYHPANFVGYSINGLRFTYTKSLDAVLVYGYVGGAETRVDLSSLSTGTKYAEMPSPGRVYVRVEPTVADDSRVVEVGVTSLLSAVAADIIITQLPFKNTWAKFNSVGKIGFMDGLVLMPYDRPAGLSKYFISGADQVQWNNNPDFFKNHTALTDSLRNITTVIFLTTGFDLTHVTDLTGFFGSSSASTNGTTNLDISSCVFPEKANYKQAFRGARGTFTGIDAINTDQLTDSDLSEFLGASHLSPMLNLSHWCVPLVIMEPYYFGRQTGYPEGHPSYGISHMPVWGTCGNSTRTVYAENFNPPNKMNRYIGSTFNFTQITNGLYTLGPFPGITYSKIRKLEFSLHFDMSFQTPWSYGFNGKVQVVVTFSNGATVKGGIHTTGSYDPVKRTIATARMTNDTPGTYVQENYNNQYFTIVATAQNPITSIQLYHGATWMGGSEEKYFAAGLRNIKITSTLL